MSDNLLPCPFCGGTAHLTDGCNYNQKTMHFVACDDTECYGGGPWRDAVEEAVEAWNTRPGPRWQGTPTPAEIESHHAKHEGPDCSSAWLRTYQRHPGLEASIENVYFMRPYNDPSQPLRPRVDNNWMAMESLDNEGYLWLPLQPNGVPVGIEVAMPK